MANVLDSITIPRSSSIPPCAIMSPTLTTSVSSLSFHRSSVTLVPEFTGLKKKIRPSFVTRSSGSVSRIVRRRCSGGGIVCEDQDTAVLAPSLTDESWKSSVLDCETTVMVEFWAPWCGPCRMIHPVIDELAKDYAGKLKCYRVNTDDCPSVATQHGIRSIPTVIIFKNGVKKDTVIGAVPKSTLVTSIEKLL